MKDLYLYNIHCIPHLSHLLFLSYAGNHIYLELLALIIPILSLIYIVDLQKYLITQYQSLTSFLF